MSNSVKKFMEMKEDMIDKESMYLCTEVERALDRIVSYTDDLDDKSFVRLRRKRNKVILLMYSIILIMFMASMSLLSQFLLFFFN